MRLEVERLSSHEKVLFGGVNCRAARTGEIIVGSEVILDGIYLRSEGLGMEQLNVGNEAITLRRLGRVGIVL
jgi:hypothetical protein